MANKDRPFGFEPVGELLRVNYYAVQTAPVINVCINDIVVHGGTSVATPKLGQLSIIEDAQVPDGYANILGVVVATFDEDFNPIQYIAAGRVGNSTIAGYVAVADHPDQMFLAQEDGDTTPIAAASAGFNANLISATLAAPNTHSGISTMEIDSDSAANTAALNVKLINPHPDDTIATAYCRWFVYINEHHYDGTIAGL